MTSVTIAKKNVFFFKFLSLRFLQTNAFGCFDFRLRHIILIFGALLCIAEVQSSASPLCFLFFFFLPQLVSAAYFISAYWPHIVSFDKRMNFLCVCGCVCVCVSVCVF